MINASSFIVCMYCSKTIATNIFLTHIPGCIKTTSKFRNQNESSF